PNAMVFSKDGKRLFVAAASSASVWVYDTFSWDPIEQISISPVPDMPPTSTPNSLSISPDGRELLVALSDANAVMMVDISNPGISYIDGFIPAGVYPTGAIYTLDGSQIMILAGKGLSSSAPNPSSTGIDTRLKGQVSLVPTPDRSKLSE